MLLLLSAVLILWASCASGQEIECRIPKMEQNIIAYPNQEKYRVGDVLKFSCRHRLTRVGPDSVQCYPFGWSPDVPVCKDKVRTCGLELPNGEVEKTREAEYMHGDQVEFHCKPGFLMKGPKKIQCVDGTWTTLPMCIEERSTCGDIPELNHGYVVQPPDPPYRHGDSVEFSCRETFTMVGHGTVTCVKGTWTQLPSCVATDQLEKCKISKSTVNEGNLRNMLEFNHNHIISYTCRGNAESKRSVCINGRWDPDVTCREVPVQLCPPPPQIPNAQDMKTTVNYQDGEKVSVLCQEGYLIQEAEEMVCKDGKWQSLPRCVEISCELPEIRNGLSLSQKKTFRENERLQYKCHSGFVYRERGDAICTASGWSPSPFCEEKTCDPPNIPNGVYSPMKNKFRPEEEITYQCRGNFRPATRESKAQCTSTGWVPTPRCNMKPCDRPQIKHGDLDYNAKYKYYPVPLGTSVYYSCEDGFLPPSENYWGSLKCTQEGWLPAVPCLRTCSKSEVELENGFLSEPYETYAVNAVTQYKCKPGYVTEDGEESGAITCLQSGWSAQPRCIST